MRDLLLGFVVGAIVIGLMNTPLTRHFMPEKQIDIETCRFLAKTALARPGGLPVFQLSECPGFYIQEAIMNARSGMKIE